MSKHPFKSKRGESGSQYRRCVISLPSLSSRAGIHTVVAWSAWGRSTRSRFEEAGCPHCEQLPIHTLGSRRTLFEEGVFASALTVLAPPRIESILNTVRRVREGLSLTVKQFQILLGLMAAASNVIPLACCT